MKTARNNTGNIVVDKPGVRAGTPERASISTHKPYIKRLEDKIKAMKENQEAMQKQFMQNLESEKKRADNSADSMCATLAKRRKSKGSGGGKV